MQQLLEGSRAVALTIKNIKPAVISAYPITPQTHIVEDLAKFKADGDADYEYVRAESEFAAASIVEGASATGLRVYTATSSQGLLLMTEVLFNIAGMRLPVVLTCANRGVSAPITIWNDHQDAMTVRDAGWVMFFAENHQEAVKQHLLAYKIAEKHKVPAMVNMDGFVLTHSYEPVEIPTQAKIKKFLPAYKPAKEEFLDPKNPVTFGAFATPAHYMEIREKLHRDLLATTEEIKKQGEIYDKIFGDEKPGKQTQTNNSLIEYYGPKKAKNLLIAMGSMAGTVKDAVDKNKNTALLKIKTFRPFPSAEILPILAKSKNIAVLEKAVSLGAEAPLSSEIKTVAQGKIKPQIKSFTVGLGGRDITIEIIEKIIKKSSGKIEGTEFIG